METKYLNDFLDTADILQIGSRNMQNFLLTECAKTNKPIMLKRHYGASLRDWLGLQNIFCMKEIKVILCERVSCHTLTEKLLDFWWSASCAYCSRIYPSSNSCDPSHATFGEVGRANEFGICCFWSRCYNAWGTSRSRKLSSWSFATINFNSLKV